jgi:hypothetical protein
MGLDPPGMLHAWEDEILNTLSKITQCVEHIVEAGDASTTGSPAAEET